MMQNTRVLFGEMKLATSECLALTIFVCRLSDSFGLLLKCFFLMEYINWVAFEASHIHAVIWKTSHYPFRCVKLLSFFRLVRTQNKVMCVNCSRCDYFPFNAIKLLLPLKSSDLGYLYLHNGWTEW